jgi:hypothetical protein
MADQLVSTVKQWGNNFVSQVGIAYSNMTPEKYIRLIAIVGAYALLRPYIMKFGSRFQSREHEKDVDEDEMAAAAAISPNSLRGQVQVPEDSDSEEDEDGKPTGADWGKKARRRQRQLVRRVLEAEEQLRREQQEDDEDKDIQEFLVD